MTKHNFREKRKRETRQRANARNVRLYFPYWQYTDLFIFRFVSLLCLRSTLRLFHFWIFYRCDPMPNLKKFCHNLRHKLVSHLFPFLTSINKLALRLFDLIFSKTRISSHITFISRCLCGKVIPHGFRSSSRFLSDEGPMLETLDYTIRIGSTPTYLLIIVSIYQLSKTPYTFLFKHQLKSGIGITRISSSYSFIEFS